MRQFLTRGARSARTGALLLAALLGLPSCGGDVTGPQVPPTAARILVVSGDRQTAVVAASLGAPLTVRVEDADGNPARGVDVRFRVVAGNGDLSRGRVGSDADGVASTTWTLGPVAADTQRVEASIPTDPRDTTQRAVVTFVAVGTPSTPAQLRVVSGDAQRAPVGADFLQPLVVQVLDAFLNPVPGVTVQWEANDAQGAVSPVSVTTDASGDAQTTRRAGDVVGQLITTARTGTLVPATFRGDVIARTDLLPATIAVADGDNQTALVGTSPAKPYAAVIKSVDGYPVQGVKVTWSTTASFDQPANTTTNADGIATFIRAFGTTAGPQYTYAAVAGLADTLRFIGTASTGSAASLAMTDGNDQTALAGARLPAALVVQVTDKYGNPVRGTTVAWAVPSNQGAVSAASTLTDSAGRAQVIRTLGTTPGTQTTTASVSGLAGSPVTFTATAQAGSPSGLTISSGDAQVYLRNATLPQPLVVHSTDALGNPVAGDTIKFELVGPPGPARFSDTLVATNTQGLASTRLTIGAVAGTYKVRATGSAFASVDFTAQAVVPQVSIASGDGQSGVVSAALSQPYVALIRAPDGTPMAGVPVAWAVQSGGGSIAPGSGSTDAQGHASAVQTLGPAIGPNTAVIRVDQDSVLFTATAAGPNGEARLEAVSGNRQYGVAGDSLPQRYIVRVLNGSGVPVAGVTVGWTITYPSASSASIGMLSTASSVTDARGQASVSATLPLTVGDSQTVVARVAALPDGVRFTSYVASSHDAARFDKPADGSGDRQQGVAGRALAQPLVARALNANGAPVAGVVVSWTVTSGGGSLGTGKQSASSITDSLGLARMTWTLGGVVDSQMVAASVPNLPALRYVAYATTDQQPATIQIVAGDQQRGIRLQTLLDSLDIVVLDGAQAPIKGVVVAWAVTSADGAVVSTPTTTTDAAGRARITVQLGGTAGQTSTIRAGILNNTKTVTFTATTTGEPAALSVDATTDAQVVTAPGVFASPLRVVVRDAAGQVVRGATVTWVATSGGGSITPILASGASGTAGQMVTSVTDQNGVAQAWRSVTGAGTITTSATLVPYTTVPSVSFTGTAK